MPRQIDVLALIGNDGRLISRTGGHRDRTTLGLKQDTALRRAFTGETVSSYEELDGRWSRPRRCRCAIATACWARCSAPPC